MFDYVTFISLRFKRKLCKGDPMGDYETSEKPES